MPRLLSQSASVLASLLAGVVFTSACASGGASGASSGVRSDDMGGATVQSTILQNAGGAARGFNTMNRTEVTSVPVAATPDRVFEALGATYAQIGIPVTDLNQSARSIGNAAFRVRRRIGDVQTVRALDCGGDSGMPNAETYQLTLTIQSRVVAAPEGGSVIQTTLEGSGRNPTTAASSDVRCSSLGALEKRIGELVKQKLATR